MKYYYTQLVSGRFRHIALAAAAFMLCLLVLAAPDPAKAQSSNMTVIRDTEIENILKAWTTPLAKAAGISPDSVNIVIIQNDQINAFVAGGQNIFIYTGLIDKTDNAGEIAGVIAHELGHISGGHLVRMRQAYENASYESMLGALLGIGVALATGEGGAGAAVSAGARSMATQRFLSHSRVQESSADQAAIAYLKATDLSAAGLVSFLSKLENQEILPASRQSEYIRTHPLSRNRIDALRKNAAYQTSGPHPYPPQWDEEHSRIRAKLSGYIRPEQVIWHYSENDSSVPSLYARAISAYRQNKTEEAISLADRLLAAEPANPYFLELKAQMLKDFGRLGEAIPLYEKALAKIGNAPLIEIDLAHVLIENSGSGQESLSRAVTLLNRALQTEKRSARARRLLATAYGRMGREAEARLQLAEEALLQGKLEYAEGLAEGAKRNLKTGTPEYQRASDILNFIKIEKDRR